MPMEIMIINADVKLTYGKVIINDVATLDQEVCDVFNCGSGTETMVPLLRYNVQLSCRRNGYKQCYGDRRKQVYEAQKYK